MKKVFLFLALLFLFGCKQAPMETVWSKTEYYEIVNMRPPKHFYLDLKRVSDGQYFYQVYISKHCNDMCIQVGDVISATYGRYKRGTYEWEEFDNYQIYNKVCSCKVY